ncbi:hypothetical protein ACHAWF_014086, partial [Thalassiosira exigua]
RSRNKSKTTTAPHQHRLRPVEPSTFVVEAPRRFHLQTKHPPRAVVKAGFEQFAAIVTMLSLSARRLRLRQSHLALTLSRAAGGGSSSSSSCSSSALSSLSARADFGGPSNPRSEAVPLPSIGGQRRHYHPFHQQSGALSSLNGRDGGRDGGRQRRAFPPGGDSRWLSSVLPDAGSLSADRDERLRSSSAPTQSRQGQSQQPNNDEIIQKLEELCSLLLAKVPKGFENFLPKNARTGDGGDDGDGDGSNGDGGDGEDDDKNKKKGKDTKKEASKSSEKEASSSSSGGGGGGSGRKRSNKNGQRKESESQRKKREDEEQKQQLIGTGILLIVVLMARSLLEDDDTANNVAGGMGGDGPEVTWSDFYNYMLTEGDVERIVVVNKKTARVILRPGARGVPVAATGARGGMMMRPSSRGISSSAKSSKDAHPVDEHWDDGTVMELSSPSAESAASSSGSTFGSLMGGNGSRAAGDRPPQLVYHFNIGSVESFEDKLTRSQQELGISPRDYVPVQYASQKEIVVDLIRLLPTVMFIGMMAYLMRGMGGLPGGGGGGRGGMGGIFQIGKSNAKLIKKEDVTVNFKDVAGCKEAKREIMEFVDFLQDSTQFTKLGAKIPKGALLTGPPGTGKTLLAKAVAGEANVPFYSISGSDFLEMFVGVGPSRVRDLFKEARANAPCIVFIDEIDAVGRQRGRGGMGGGNDERENTLNQMLVEMDGFTPSTGVVVLAGTNRADILDKALTRPGRFDRQITVDLPDLTGRKEIFLIHLQGIELEADKEDIAGRLAGLTPGMAGADIANVCNEAAIVAARRKADSVTMEDFEKATDRIIGGLESNKIMSDDERSIVAHHEAGHAVAGWFLEHADPLLKVTIIPRTSGALGYAQYLPKEVFLRTQEQIMDIVKMALAGRAAEEVFFGGVTTGASDDLRRVTQLVYSTIQVYGMNDRVGQLAFPKDPNDMPGEKPYSDKTAETMDEEARTIVDEAYRMTVELIKEKRSEVETLAKLLLKQETITHDDVVDAIGDRPFKGHVAYDEFVSQRKAAAGAAKDGEKETADKKEGEKEEDQGNDGLTPGLAL